MKKTYERPKLVEHGDIRKMTRSTNGHEFSGEETGDN